MSNDGDRVTQLHALKLHALVRDHLGREPEGEPRPTGPVTALIDGRDVWALVHEGATRVLGPALLWARREGGEVLHLVADSGSGPLARQAELLAPEVNVWSVEGRTLHPAIPTPRPVTADPPPDHDLMRPVIEAAGADVVAEHGVLSGEVAGLEVCIVATVPTDGRSAVRVTLEVGVGAADREAFALMYPDLSPDEALTRVVAAVAPHRAPGAAPHPFNRLAGQRLLRHRALSRPGLVGLTELSPAPPPVPRHDLADAAPCVAVGRDAAGVEHVVVFSVGVDPDLVPFAADARDALGPTARLVLAVPERDTHLVRSLSTGWLEDNVTVIGLGSALVAG